jgi:hypothetical protein
MGIYKITTRLKKGVKMKYFMAGSREHRKEEKEAIINDNQLSDIKANEQFILIIELKEMLNDGAYNTIIERKEETTANEFVIPIKKSIETKIEPIKRIITKETIKETIEKEKKKLTQAKKTKTKSKKTKTKIKRVKNNGYIT